tara:strand:+ start:6122 stop:6268 length:147 start_codon:yes stop_codon:yes gene_type:complete
MNSLNIVDIRDKILSQYCVFYFKKRMFIRVKKPAHSAEKIVPFGWFEK